MHPIKRSPLAAAMLLALNSPFFSPTANAATSPVLGPVAGSEFQVNTYTSSSQNNASVAMDASGNYVVAWQSNGQDSDKSIGIYAQRYNADGTANGSEFQVNTYVTGDQANPKVAMDASGDFVIVWEDPAQDGDAGGIYAQRYNADGTAAGGEFLVNTTTVNDQITPDVAMDASGDFVVVWDSYTHGAAPYDEIYGQRYNADGSAAGTEFHVNTTTTSGQVNPSVAMDAAGDFVVAWSSLGQDGSAYGIYAQRYAADGTPDVIKGEFQVNQHITDSQDYSSVAMDAAGDFVIAWSSQNQDGAATQSIYARRYDSAGNDVSGGEFKVNTNSYFEYLPSVAMDTAGDFVISWQSLNNDGSSNGVAAQAYAADGTPSATGEFQVNTYTTSNQNKPSIAMDADGAFVIAWQSQGQDVLTDPLSDGVYAQRYSSTAAASVDLNLVVNDDTDPVTVGSNFMYTLITTNNSTGYAMDVNLSEPVPTGLTYVSDDAATSGWTCTQAATTLNCNKPYMTAGEVSTINVTVKANTAGLLSNTVTATSAQTDINSADNTNTETTQVNGTSSGGGGSFGVFSLLLAIPLWLRRRWLS